MSIIINQLYSEINVFQVNLTSLEIHFTEWCMWDILTTALVQHKFHNRNKLAQYL